MNNRRKILVALGASVLTAPFATFVQQPAMPVIGFLGSRTPDESPTRFWCGLTGQSKDSGSPGSLEFCPGSDGLKPANS